MLRTVSFFTIFVICFFTAQAQPLYFEKAFGRPGIDEAARSVKQLSDGSIYVAGYAYLDSIGGAEISLTKLNRYGEVIWTRYYGTVNNDYALYLNTCSDGNLVIGGRSDSSNASSDALLLKTDTSGGVILFKIYRKPSMNEEIKFIEETPDNGFIACGFITETHVNPYNDCYVIKLDASGEEEWVHTTDYHGNDYADAVHRTEEGDYVVTGDMIDTVAKDYDIYVYKLSPSGELVWDLLIGDSYNNGCQTLIITSEKDYLVVGESHVDETFKFDLVMARISPEGALKWMRFIPGPGTDAAFSVVENQWGNFVMAGYSNSNNPSAPIDVFIMEADSSANKLGERYYGSGSIDIAYDIIHSADNGYLVAGMSFSGDNNHYYLIHCSQEDIFPGTSFSENSDGIMIYPQPAPGNFYIQVSEQVPDARISIVNSSGQLVYENTAELSGSFLIEAGLSPGLYILQITGPKEILSGKLMIE